MLDKRTQRYRHLILLGWLCLGAALPAGSAAERTAGPAAADAVDAEYQVQPEDVLEITVYQEPDLTTKARVTASGEITFPLLGRVPVADRTVMEVQEQLTRALDADYLVSPQVRVFIDTYHTRNVFVTGAVNKPGSYPMQVERPTTIMEMIAQAGGFKEEAAINKTRIIRSQDGQERSIEVRVDDIVKKGQKDKDVTVQPNDVIFVPESFF